MAEHDDTDTGMANGLDAGTTNTTEPAAGAESVEPGHPVKRRRRGERANTKRLNLALDDDTYDYCYTMARMRGMTVTGFVNHVLRASMRDNAQLYAAATAFLHGMKEDK